MKSELQKTGLREASVMDKLAAARSITESIIQYSPLTLSQNVYANKSGNSIFPIKLARALGRRTNIVGNDKISSGASVHLGGFEVLGTNGDRVALVTVFSQGKPTIHVKKDVWLADTDNERLGRDLAKAFKTHAKYFLRPSVKVRNRLPTIERHLAPKVR